MARFDFWTDNDFTNPKKFVLSVVGQGFVGKHLADWLEERGFRVIRIDKDSNKKLYKTADIFFVCVPTPTRNLGFDGSIVAGVLAEIPEGSLVCIRSTVPPDFLMNLVKAFPSLVITHVPEFLDASNAKQDTESPRKLIIGADVGDGCEYEIHQLLHEILPNPADEEKIQYCELEEAAFVKYASNGFFMVKNVYFNLLADIAHKKGWNFEDIRACVAMDDRIGHVHTNPVDKGGRGAGGPCLPKDFAVLANIMVNLYPIDYQYGCVPNHKITFFKEVQDLNFYNLLLSGKDPEIRQEVYGKKS